MWTSRALHSWRAPQVVRLTQPSSLQIRARSTVRMSTANPIIFYDLLPAPGGCPYAQRAWLAMDELKVPYEKKLIDKANKSEEFLSLFRGIVQDPQGKGTVPTIIDGDYKLTESAVVVEYLDKKYGKPGQHLVPEKPEELGKVKLFLEVFPANFNANIFKIFKADNHADLAEAVKATDASAKVLDNFIKVNGSSQGGSYFLGSQYSIAETFTTPFVKRMVVCMPAIGKYDYLKSAKDNGLDRLVAWIEASLSRPSATTATCSDAQMVESMSQFNTPLKD